MHRRRFFHYCSIVLSGLTALLVGLPGAAFLVDPLFRQRQKSKRHRLVKLDDLPTGKPRKLVIVDQRVDAWTRYPEGPIGAVWLVRRDDDSVDAYSTTCPHLGCTVNLADDTFFCPCHEARFAMDGSTLDGPQLRGMDKLDAMVAKIDDDDWVQVDFQRFELGVAEKTPLG